MATSGSYNFNMNVGDVISFALELVGFDPGETISASDYDSTRKVLNMMIRAWQADGIGLWKNKEIAVFLSYAGYQYDIGPSGDHAATTWVKTEVKTAAVSGAGTVVVDSITGMTDGDYIGVELDDGTLQWTTINGAPAAYTVTLTDVLTDAAAVDNHVYTYTALTQRPISIIDARLHSPDSIDTPLSIISREEYKALSNKTADGRPSQIYYDPQLTNGSLHVYPAANDVQYYIEMTGRIPIEDVDEIANDFDFPQEWYEALVYNLARRRAPVYGITLNRGDDILTMAYETKARLEAFDVEDTSVFIKISTGR